MASIALRLERAGAWQLCRSVADIEASIAEGRFAAVMHMEGCEAIGAIWRRSTSSTQPAFARSGPVWSRNNVFGHGVPFASPCRPTADRPD